MAASRDDLPPPAPTFSCIHAPFEGLEPGAAADHRGPEPGGSAADRTLQVPARNSSLSHRTEVSADVGGTGCGILLGLACFTGFDNRLNRRRSSAIDAADLH